MVILSFFRLIRLPILLFVAAIQSATRWFIIKPMIELNGFDFIMADFQFLLLVLSSMLIGGAGYAINDYFDVKIDRINKPKTIIVGRLIKRRVAMATHVIMTGLGLTTAFYLCYSLGIWELTSLFVLAAFLLWLYSTNLQHTIFFGNLVIALIAGFAPLIVGLFEIPLLNNAHPDIIERLGYSPFNGPAYWIMGYSAVLFLLTLAREITKDVIDVRGDKYYEARTIPVELGIAKTKAIIMLVYAVLGAILSYFYFSIVSIHTGMTSIFITLCLVLVSQFGLIFKSRTKKHFLYSANLNVIATLLIVLSMYLLQVSIHQHFS